MVRPFAANDAAPMPRMKPINPPPKRRTITAIGCGCGIASIDAGADALSDYELLEMVLLRAMPRRDVKPLAKSLIGKFGSFAEVVMRRKRGCAKSNGVGEPPSPSSN